MRIPAIMRSNVLFVMNGIINDNNNITNDSINDIIKDIAQLCP